MGYWFIFGLFALILWGVWGFLPKLATRYIEPRSVLVFQTIGSILVTIVILATIDFKPELHTKGVTLAIVTGIIGTLGTASFLYSIAKGKASIVVTMTALYPIITIILSLLILKESITIKQGIAIILALTAMALFAS
ncbi:EamA family transporter [candidate division WOR-3 bacterium]|nr:EamA family transporter [candidate division WOR-3 bacterium]